MGGYLCNRVPCEQCGGPIEVFTEATAERDGLVPWAIHRKCVPAWLKARGVSPTVLPDWPAQQRAGLEVK